MCIIILTSLSVKEYFTEKKIESFNLQSGTLITDVTITNLTPFTTAFYTVL